MHELTQFGGLNTDDPPDRLQSSAMRLENVIPASATTITSRPGVSLETHDQTNMVGRNVIVDGLPGDGGGALLVSFDACSDDGSGDSSDEIDGLYRFRPNVIADEYSTTRGVAESTIIYGIVF